VITNSIIIIRPNQRDSSNFPFRQLTETIPNVVVMVKMGYISLKYKFLQYRKYLYVYIFICRAYHRSIE